MATTTKPKIGKLPSFTDVANAPVVTGKARSMANLRKGGGRPKGVPNATTGALKEMILGALDKAGGEEYLVKQAQMNPGAFLSLIGKVLPTELKNAEPGGFIVHVTTGVSRE